MNYTLLCGFFVRAANPLPPDNAEVLVRAGCQFWKRPLYVYVGLNNSLADTPGFRLPRWARPSPMLLQLRDFHPERPVPRFDRYQSLDFDFGLAPVTPNVLTGGRHKVAPALRSAIASGGPIAASRMAA